MKFTRSLVVPLLAALVLVLVPGLPPRAQGAQSVLAFADDLPEDIRNQAAIDALDAGWNGVPWGTTFKEFQKRFPNSSRSTLTDGPGEYRKGQDSENFCGLRWEVRYRFAPLAQGAEPQLFSVVFYPPHPRLGFDFGYDTLTSMVQCLGLPRERPGGPVASEYYRGSLVAWRSSSGNVSVEHRGFLPKAWITARSLTGPDPSGPTMTWDSFRRIGTVEFQSGSKFNPALLEQSLRTGSSTQGDVQAALGEPYGRGRALMPFHEGDRTVWTYYYERGSIDASTFATKDQRIYLFVFFAEDRFDGYMWFASEMR